MFIKHVYFIKMNKNKAIVNRDRMPKILLNESSANLIR